MAPGGGGVRPRGGWPLPLALVPLLLAGGVDCRRDIELTVPRSPPEARCLANSLACVDAGDCCSGACVSGQCVSPTVCGGEGQLCTHSFECCSLVCGQDPAGSGTLVCRNPFACGSVGQPCQRAGACCSLGCAGIDSSHGCTDAMCAPVGAACEIPRDCCSDVCSSGVCAPVSAGCRPAGETCGGDADCCGGSCVPPTPGAAVRRCALLPYCRVSGETCNSAADCCSGICINTASSSQICSAAASCRVALDACQDDGECCSGRCRARVGGTSRCELLLGCQPTGERCASGANCCSGSCEVDADGVSRCVLTRSCRPLGDVCRASSECCEGGATACRLGLNETLRCLATPGKDVCTSDGVPCAISELCCLGLCGPDGLGARTCKFACAPRGSPCSGDLDCCGRACVGPPGKTTCDGNGPTGEPEPGDPGPRCARPGETCDPVEDFCCIGTQCARGGDGTQVCAVVPTQPRLTAGEPERRRPSPSARPRGR